MRFHRNVAVRSRWFLPAVGLAWLLVAGCAAHGPEPAAGTSIPPIACIAGVQIGYSTQKDLDKAWGEGLTTVGGHPNSGRVWRVRGTHWQVATDGFDYSERGLVVDGLRISEVPDESESWRHVPDARPGKQAFAWLDEISPGMLRDEVIAALKRHSLAFTPTNDAIKMQARGFSPVTSLVGYNFRMWTVTLEFQHDELSGLLIDADLEKESH